MTEDKNMVAYLVWPNDGHIQELAGELRAWEDVFDFKWAVVMGVAIVTGTDASDVVERVREDMLLFHRETLLVEAA